MWRKVIGIAILIIFGFNLIYSLFFTMGESFASHIPAIGISAVMLFIGYQLVRRHHARPTNDKSKQ